MRFIEFTSSISGNKILVNTDNIEYISHIQSNDNNINITDDIIYFVSGKVVSISDGFDTIISKVNNQD